VLFALPFGLLVVMRRTDRDLAEHELPLKSDFEGLPADFKSDNFGWLNDKIVLRDYG